MEATTYTLRPPVPLSSFGLAAAFLVFGLAIGAYAFAAPSLVWLAVALLMVGIFLGAWLAWQFWTGAATLALDAAGLTVTRRSSEPLTVPWSQVERVSGDATSLTFALASGKALTLRQRTSKKARATLEADVAKRLDADRGYRSM